MAGTMASLMEASGTTGNSPMSTKGPGATTGSFRIVRSLPKLSGMPRDGPTPGGGLLQVKDRTLYDGQIKEAIDAMDNSLPDGLHLQDRKGRQRRPSALTTSNWSHGTGDWSGRRGEAKSNPRATASSGFSESPRSSAAGYKESNASNKRLGPQERKQQEMYFKWQKMEAVRDRDQKTIQERIEKGKDMREARYKRLLAGVAGEGKLASETAKCLRDRLEYEDQRRKELHTRWQKNIYYGLCEQLDRRLNPQNRMREQMLAGRKSVGWEDDFSVTENIRRSQSAGHL